MSRSTQDAEDEREADGSPAPPHGGPHATLSGLERGLGVHVAGSDIGAGALISSGTAGTRQVARKAARS